NSKYDPLAKIFVYYQNHIRHILEISGIKKLRNYDPKESCKLARHGDVPEKIRLKGLILARIIDPTTEDIVEQVQAFANTFDVMATEI
uniref:Uncharacterized protein n=1 Tax=Panagrolaimus sp. JU765 TaxID=591449 RepID=A0AC34R5E8_9BILA